MAEINIISDKEVEAEFNKVSVQGKWAEVIKDVLKDGKARKVTKLSRGQVAALYRTAKDKGLRVKTSYKDGTVILAKVIEPETPKE